MTDRTVPTIARTIYTETVPTTDDEPHPRYEVQVETIHRADTGDTIAIRARARIGHGLGPHWSHSARRLRAFGWACIHAADHLDTANSDTPPQHEQLPFPTPRRARR